MISQEYLVDALPFFIMADPFSDKEEVSILPNCP